jgi:hypothetical protein
MNDAYNGLLKSEQTTQNADKRQQLRTHARASKASSSPCPFKFQRLQPIIPRFLQVASIFFTSPTLPDPRSLVVIHLQATTHLTEPTRAALTAPHPHATLDWPCPTRRLRPCSKFLHVDADAHQLGPDIFLLILQLLASRPLFSTSFLDNQPSTRLPHATRNASPRPLHHESTTTAGS